MSNLSIHMFCQSILCLKIKRTELAENVTSKDYKAFFLFDTVMA
jgi:dihydroorotase